MNGQRIITDLKSRDRDGVIELPIRPPFRRGDRVGIIRGALHGQLAIFADMRPKKHIEILLYLFGALSSLARYPTRQVKEIFLGASPKRADSQTRELSPVSGVKRTSR